MNIPTLRKGDTIAIICTAKSIEAPYIVRAKKLLENWGLHVLVGKNLLNVHHQFAGTDKERAEDLQTAINNKEVKAILCARGGYGTVRIIDQIDFSIFTQHPKWIIGYSDITVLHNHIHEHLNFPTIHGTVPLNFPENGQENTALSSLKKLLFEGAISYEIESSPLNLPGEVTAPIIGGNLSILYSLTGTNSDISTEGKILFLEDLCEYAYHVDRMLWNLKKAGKLKGLAGLVVGAFTDIKQGPVPFGQTAEEMILEMVKEYNFPVCFNFPAGHIEDNRALLLGMEAHLISTSSADKTTQLHFYGRTQ